jgi:quercetin dioxygenase-like cupin family protein
MKAKVSRSTELRFKALPGRDSADPFEPHEGEDDSSLRVVKMKSDPMRGPHMHPQSSEAVYVASGHGTLWVEGERIDIHAGDTFLVPAGAKHATLPDADSEMELICFFPHPELAKNILEFPGPISSDVGQ